MKDFTKNLLKCTLTLMAIAGASTLLIGATNAITAPVIEENAKEKEAQQLAVVFDDDPDNLQYDYTSVEISDAIAAKLTYVQKEWTVTKKDDGSEIGYICRVYGKNGYGDIDILVGIKPDYSLSKIAIISDTMTYKSKLEPNYIDVYNAAEDGDAKAEALENVTCGATFAAKLVRDGVKEALKLVKGEIKAGLEDEAKLFGTDETYTEVTSSMVTSDLTYVNEAWQCSQGYVFKATGTTTFDTEEGESCTTEITIWVAIANDGSIVKIYLASDGSTAGTPSDYVDAVNSADDKLTALSNVTTTGSTYSNNLIKAMVLEAKEIIAPSVPEKAMAIYGTDKTYSAVTLPSDVTYTKHGWKCDEGYVFDCVGTEEEFSGTLKLYVGVNADGTIKQIVLYSDGSSSPNSSGVSDYISGINDATDKDTAIDSVSNGATLSNNVAKAMILEAKSLVSESKVASVDFTSGGEQTFSLSFDPALAGERR